MLKEKRVEICGHEFVVRQLPLSKAGLFRPLSDEKDDQAKVNFIQACVFESDGITQIDIDKYPASTMFAELASAAIAINAGEEGKG